MYREPPRDPRGGHLMKATRAVIGQICEVDGLPGELSWISPQVSGFKVGLIERQRLRYVNTPSVITPSSGHRGGTSSSMRNGRFTLSDTHSELHAWRLGRTISHSLIGYPTTIQDDAPPWESLNMSVGSYFYES